MTVCERCGGDGAQGTGLCVPCERELAQAGEWRADAPLTCRCGVVTGDGEECGECGQARADYLRELRGEP